MIDKTTTAGQTEMKMADTKPEAYVASDTSSREEHVGIGELKQEPRWKAWARTLSIEVVGGIQRVTEEERKQNTTHVWNACTFW